MGALMFLALIFLAPIAAATDHSELALSIYGPFGTLCHQLPERSFFIAGHKLAVCARCSGIYAGFALVSLFYPLARPLRATINPPVKWLFLAAVPMAIDFSLTFFGYWENTHTTRLITGLLLGGVAVFYVIPGIIELSMRGRETQDAARKTILTNESPAAVVGARSDYSAPYRRI